MFQSIELFIDTFFCMLSVRFNLLPVCLLKCACQKYFYLLHNKTLLFVNKFFISFSRVIHRVCTKHNYKVGTVYCMYIIFGYFLDEDIYNVNDFEGTVSRDIKGYRYCHISIESSFQGLLSPIIKF